MAFHLFRQKHLSINIGDHDSYLIFKDQKFQLLVDSQTTYKWVINNPMEGRDSW